MLRFPLRPMTDDACGPHRRARAMQVVAADIAVSLLVVSLPAGAQTSQGWPQRPSAAAPTPPPAPGAPAPGASPGFPPMPSAYPTPPATTPAPVTAPAVAPPPATAPWPPTPMPAPEPYAPAQPGGLGAPWGPAAPSPYPSPPLGAAAYPPPGADPLGNATRTELRFEAERRDPAAAALLSTFLGFGSGHFYCRQWTAAGVAAGTQAVGLALAGGGLALDGVRDKQARVGLLVVGGLLAGFGRIFDIGWAPASAHARNRELLRELRVTPMGGGGPSGVGPTGAGVTGQF